MSDKIRSDEAPTPRLNPAPWAEFTKEKKQVIWICLLLVVVTTAVYCRVATHSFINYDDPDYVTWNPYVQAGLKFGSVVWAFHDVSANWHPLTWISHMLDCQMYGLDPGGHHM